MSGIIAYAILRYRRKRPSGNTIWEAPLISKQHKQSDRAFIKMCERVVKSHDTGYMKGTDITLNKPGAKYYNKSDKEITAVVMNYVR